MPRGSRSRQKSPGLTQPPLQRPASRRVEEQSSSSDSDDPHRVFCVSADTAAPGSPRQFLLGSSPPAMMRSVTQNFLQSEGGIISEPGTSTEGAMHSPYELQVISSGGTVVAAAASAAEGGHVSSPRPSTFPDTPSLPALSEAAVITSVRREVQLDFPPFHDVPDTRSSGSAMTTTRGAADVSDRDDASSSVSHGSASAKTTTLPPSARGIVNLAETLRPITEASTGLVTGDRAARMPPVGSSEKPDAAQAVSAAVARSTRSTNARDDPDERDVSRRVAAASVVSPDEVLALSKRRQEGRELRDVPPVELAPALLRRRNSGGQASSSAHRRANTQGTDSNRVKGGSPHAVSIGPLSLAAVDSAALGRQRDPSPSHRQHRVSASPSAQLGSAPSFSALSPWHSYLNQQGVLRNNNGQQDQQLGSAYHSTLRRTPPPSFAAVVDLSPAGGGEPTQGPKMSRSVSCDDISSLPRSRQAVGAAPMSSFAAADDVGSYLASHQHSRHEDVESNNSHRRPPLSRHRVRAVESMGTHFSMHPRSDSMPVQRTAGGDMFPLSPSFGDRGSLSSPNATPHPYDDATRSPFANVSPVGSPTRNSRGDMFAFLHSQKQSSGTNLKGDVHSPRTPASGKSVGSNGGASSQQQLQKQQKARPDRAVDVAVDEDDFLEKQRRNAAVSSAIHSIPWLQRQVEPFAAFGSDKCNMCVAPKFWERLDWTLRATFLCVLPAVILSLDPATTGYFPLPSNVASFAFWITAPTFGGGLREALIVVKGSIVSLAFLCIIIAINPVDQKGLFVALYFLQILIVAFVAESIKKTSAWCISVFMLQFYSAPNETGFLFVRDFFMSVLIGCGVGICSFLLPRINWAHKLAFSCCYAYGSTVSIAVQGVANSFWAKSDFERDFCLIRLRQLMSITSNLQKTLAARLSEAEYEPHTGLTLAKIRKRADFLDDVTRIVACLQQIVENVAVKPEIVCTPLLKPFGERMEEPLTVLASAMDSTILKICDFKHPVSDGDLMLFRRVRDEFQFHLSATRQDLILSNDSYRTDESDIFLGSFLFCIDELADAISSFSEPTEAPSRLYEWLTTPWHDVLSLVDTITVFFKILVTQGSLIRRAKEAIKLSLSMTIPLIIQVFLLEPQDATPVAGPSIIAWVYQRTGAESFHYASNRVLGTVIGSLTALISVQLASGRLYVLYIFLAILALFGTFVQTSVTYTQAGNALVFSVISIMSQYKDSSAAMGRIQQNVFAILIYFGISWVLWPVRAIEKLQIELDSSLRSYREAIYKLLGNMDSSLEDVQQVCAEVEEHWRDCLKHTNRQASLVPAAVKEPTLIGAPFPEQPWQRVVRSQYTFSNMAWMMRFAFKTFEEGHSTTQHSLHWVVVRRLAPKVREVAELIFAACDLYLLALSHAAMVPISHLVRLRLAMVEQYRQIVDVYVSTLILKLGEDAHEESTSTDDENVGVGDDTIVIHKTPAAASSTPSKQQERTPSTEVLPQSSAKGKKNATSEEQDSPVFTPLEAQETMLPNNVSDADALPANMKAGQPGVPPAATETKSTTAAVLKSDDCAGATADVSTASESAANTSFILTNRDIHSLEAFLFGIRATVHEIGEFQKALLDMQHAIEVSSKM